MFCLKKRIISIGLSVILACGVVSVTPAAEQHTEKVFARELPEKPKTTKTEKWKVESEKHQMTLEGGPRIYDVRTYTVTTNGAPGDNDYEFYKNYTYNQNTEGAKLKQSLLELFVKKGITSVSSIAGNLSFVKDVAKTLYDAKITKAQLNKANSINHDMDFYTSTKYVYVKVEGDADDKWQLSYQGSSTLVIDNYRLVANGKKKKRKVVKYKIQSPQYNRPAHMACEYFHKVMEIGSVVEVGSYLQVISTYSVYKNKKKGKRVLIHLPVVYHKGF